MLHNLFVLICFRYYYLFVLIIIIIIIIIIIMLNIISHGAEILVSLVFTVKADINQMSKVSQQYSFLGTSQDSTFLIILAVPNNAYV